MTAKSKHDRREVFSYKSDEKLRKATQESVHSLGKNIICRTDDRARKRSPLSIVVDATDGFVPLWEENMVLHWRFNQASLAPFDNPDEITEKVRNLFHKAIAAWGDAAPIRFLERTDNFDFEIVVEQNDDCTLQGCTLAQAFFPDAGRHPLYVFPKMFEQSEKEQIDTLTHEAGHVFGLRHFFAPDAEARWPSVVFGDHLPFSIMNYGANSELTDADRRDLKLLYEGAWSKKLRNINGTPIKLVRPYHYLNA